MRVEVDLGLCQGHGVCESEAPKVFKVSKETGQVEILDPTPGDELRAQVDAAVKYCPTLALKLKEDN
ncbi:MAG: ferredoxin [Actinomycetota bacterium]